MLYIVLILFLLVSFSSFFKYEDHVKNLLFFTCWVACVVIAGLRAPGCDKDSLAYLTVFNQESVNILVEKSFYLISSLVKFCCGPDFFFVLFLYAFIGVSAKFLAIRQLTELWMLASAIYISNFFLLQEMTQIRIGIATGMLLLCIKPLYERRWKSFLLFAGIGTVFHYAALVVLPFWFLNIKSFNKYLYATVLILAYCFFFAGFSITELLNYIPVDYIKEKLALNLEATKNELAINPFTIFQSLRLLIAGILFWKLERIVTFNKYVPLLLKIYVFGIASFLLFTDVPTFTLRISEFLEVVEIILIPSLVYAFKDRRIGIWLPISIAVFFIGMNLFYSELIS